MKIGGGEEVRTQFSIQHTKYAPKANKAKDNFNFKMGISILFQCVLFRSNRFLFYCQSDNN